MIGIPIMKDIPILGYAFGSRNPKYVPPAPKTEAALHMSDDVRHLRIEILDYDQKTKSGYVTVSFDDGYFDAAKAWTRQNIFEIARDRNVLLTSRHSTDDARFYLGSETVSGNLLCVEFTTE